MSCKKCVALADNTTAVARAAGIDIELEKITDIVAIATFGVMSTPCLVVNEKVVSRGKVLSVDEIGDLLKAA